MSETKYVVKFTMQFKKDFKLAMKRGFKMDLLEDVITLLAMGELLPDKNKDHTLTGNWVGHLIAFDRMLEERRRRGKLDGSWHMGTTAEDVFHWWMEDDFIRGQMSLEEFLYVCTAYKATVHVNYKRGLRIVYTLSKTCIIQTFYCSSFTAIFSVSSGRVG